SSGILVTQVAVQKVDPPGSVLEAFRDVQAARADKERSVNEAQAYFNQKTNTAEGQAQQIIKSAEAYKEQKIAIAQGDAKRFISVYAQYVKAKDITQRRIYLETMQQIMKGMDKVLIDESLKGGGAVPYLSLNELLKQRAAPPPAAAGATEQGGSQ